MQCTNYQQCKNGIERGKWCSDRCRMSYTRTNPNKNEQEGEQIQPEQANPNINKTDPDAPNYYYTIKNFPLPKYHSPGGGGQGSYSPYPQSNPKSLAYAVR